MNNENKGMLLGVLGVISFGLTLPLTRFILPYFDPMFIGLGRATLAAVVAPMILFAFKQAVPSRDQIGKLTIVAIGVVIGFPVLSAYAMQDLPASHGGVVLGIIPLGTAIAALFVTNDRPSIGFWIVGILGSTSVITYSVLQGAGDLQIGDLFLFGAVICASFGYAVGGQLSKEMGGWQVICWALVIALPFILIPTYLYAPDKIQVIPRSAVYSFLYLALVSQLFAFFLWNAGLAIGGVTRVSQTQLIQPFVTIGVSALLLNEFISFQTIGFAALVVALVALGKQMPIHTSDRKS
jgi:drug/metabolite transporter (DMT)-like permease